MIGLEVGGIVPAGKLISATSNVVIITSFPTEQVSITIEVGMAVLSTGENKTTLYRNSLALLRYTSRLVLRIVH